jgi:hypothetical protein
VLAAEGIGQRVAIKEWLRRVGRIFRGMSARLRRRAASEACDRARLPAETALRPG